MYQWIIKGLWSLGSLICSIFALISAVVPVLPMTPWVIAAAFCLMKVVPAFQRRYEAFKLKIKEKLSQKQMSPTESDD